MAAPAVLVGLAIVIVLAALILLRKKTPKATPALDQREYRAFKLIEKKDVTQVGPGIMFKTTFFRFALPSPSMRLGLPVGQHISLRFTGEDGKMISRPYTPVSSDDDLGYFDLLIKIYDKGAMGQYLDKLAVGKTVDVKGPTGAIEYKDNGLFTIARKNEETKEKKVQNVTVRRLGLIAGGTGLTPMLQITKRILKNKNDPTQVSLIFANQSEPDILLRGELEALVAANPGRFNLFFTIDNPKLPEPLPHWKGGRGFVSTAMISALQDAGTFPRAGADSLVLLCGPPLMLTFVGDQLRKGLDFTDDMLACF